MSEIVIGNTKCFFSWLPNYLVNDPNFSAESIAAALYLNGKPPGWRARPLDIRKRFGWGDRKWRKISLELKSYNILHEKKVADGTILWFELLETIDSKPSVENQQVDNPIEHPPVHLSRVLKPTRAKCTALANKELNKKDFIKNRNTLCASDLKNNVHPIFEQLWQAYPHKKAKQKALEAFEHALAGKDEAETKKLLEAICRGFKAHLDEHNAKQQLKRQGADVWIPQLPHLSTWLNQSRWDDGYALPADLLANAQHKGGIVDINRVFGGV